MDVSEIAIGTAEAKRLYREYKANRHFDSKMDAEITRAYQLISQGKMVIDARRSITEAGLGDDGRPKLAICPATAKVCFLEMLGGNDSAANRKMAWRFSAHQWPRTPSQYISVPTPVRSPLFDARVSWNRDVLVSSVAAKAQVPIIPARHRPKAPQHYHILWEADWVGVPVDPLLLRRIGKSDMWLVVAAWDLTEVERAAMSSRLT